MSNWSVSRLSNSGVGNSNIPGGGVWLPRRRIAPFFLFWAVGGESPKGWPIFEGVVSARRGVKTAESFQLLQQPRGDEAVQDELLSRILGWHRKWRYCRRNSNQVRLGIGQIESLLSNLLHDSGIKLECPLTHTGTNLKQKPSSGHPSGIASRAEP